LKDLKNKLFWIDEEVTYTYGDLLNLVNTTTEVPKYLKNENTFIIITNIILSILGKNDIVLLDSDLTDTELGNLNLPASYINVSNPITKNKFNSVEDLINTLTNSKIWNVTLFTSGTTGNPKRIIHSIRSVNRHVQISESHINDIWGFAYNPTHIAGLQVFMQGLLNKNTIVFLFKKQMDTIIKLIKETNVTHLSAAPTFYRQMFKNISFPNVRRVTSGGEKLDANTKDRILALFPNAKYRNVYASTEAGTIFTSKEDIFEIIPDLIDKVKINNNEIVIHESLIGKTDALVDEWFRTGDMVEIVSQNPLRFKINHRTDDLINVGGLQINPHEIEDQIKTIPNVIDVIVYGKPNTIIGNVLCADVVGEITELRVLNYLRKNLQRNKIPRIINIVDQIVIGKTGKKKRV